MRPILTIMFIILNCFCELLSQKIDNNDSLINQIALLSDSIKDYNVLTSEEIGYPPVISKQYVRFKAIVDKATEVELLYMVKQPNGVLKCYAFWALYKRNYTNIFQILLDNIEDNRKVKTFFADIAGSTAVNSFFVSLLLSSVNEDNAYLSDCQKQKIDSIVLYNDNVTTDLKNLILTSYKPRKHDYNQIKKIAFQNKTRKAIDVLASYQRDDDLPFFLNLFKDEGTVNLALSLSRYFIHESIYREIIKIHEKELDKKKDLDYAKINLLYEALVQYPTEQTVDLLNKSIKKIKGFAGRIHRLEIYKALDKYPNAIFTEVKTKIKLSKTDLFELENL